MFLSNGWHTWVLAGLYVICIAIVIVLEWNARKKAKKGSRQESGRR